MDSAYVRLVFRRDIRIANKSLLVISTEKVLEVVTLDRTMEERKTLKKKDKENQGLKINQQED